jgi:bifunctional DNA-binding transcriptional regulator/antitoxin component of YhaV-PrlF toxin-antitoxin module
LPSTGVSTIEQGGSHRAVVPKQIRQDMDLDEGDELKWVYDDGVLTVYLHSKHGE